MSKTIIKENFVDQFTKIIASQPFRQKEVKTKLEQWLNDLWITMSNSEFDEFLWKLIKINTDAWRWYWKKHQESLLENDDQTSHEQLYPWWEVSQTTSAKNTKINIPKEKQAWMNIENKNKQNKPVQKQNKKQETIINNKQEVKQESSVGSKDKQSWFKKAAVAWVTITLLMGWLITWSNEDWKQFPRNAPSGTEELDKKPPTQWQRDLGNDATAQPWI